MFSANPINSYGKAKFARSASYSQFRFVSLDIPDILIAIIRVVTEWEELRILSDQVGAPTCVSGVAAATTKSQPV